jgi:hypothetical protein
MRAVLLAVLAATHPTFGRWIWSVFSVLCCVSNANDPDIFLGVVSHTLRKPSQARSSLDRKCFSMSPYAIIRSR